MSECIKNRLTHGLTRCYCNLHSCGVEHAAVIFDHSEIVRIGQTPSFYSSILIIKGRFRRFAKKRRAPGLVHCALNRHERRQFMPAGAKGGHFENEDGKKGLAALFNSGMHDLVHPVYLFACRLEPVCGDCLCGRYGRDSGSPRWGCGSVRRFYAKGRKQPRRS